MRFSVTISCLFDPNHLSPIPCYYRQNIRVWFSTRW